MSEDKHPNKLYRSHKDKIFAGVAGGIGEYFVIDPIIVRLIFVVLAFINGVGILAYILGMIIIPRNASTHHDGSVEEKIEDFATEVKEGAETLVGHARESTTLSSRRNMIAAIIIFVGCIALARQVFHIRWFVWDVVWPILLIVLGVTVLLSKSKKHGH